MSTPERIAAARFILANATELRISIGTNGTDDLVMVAPLALPFACRRSFERALDEYRDELIEIVWREGHP